MNVGDKIPYPEFLGMGFAGSLEPNDNYREIDGLYLPESAIAKLPAPPPKREIGFHATQVRLQQGNSVQEHQDRNG